jgi:glycosyltransferase involved in cell wall biosynthesis
MSQEECERQKRVLVFIVAYNAEKTIQEVVRRIPSSLAQYDTEVLIIDDSSQDETFAKARLLEQPGGSPFPLTVLFNPVNQGYGGNQKIGFHYAMENGFDYVALVHGDGQYAPERLPELLQPLLHGEADAVFGSRMMRSREALRGGMPLYKYVGNKILSWLQNRLLHSDLSEFHSGYRIYSTGALRRIPFDRNTNGFPFDTEIIIQLMRGGLRIKEAPIPTYYGDEICRVNGLRYAWDVVKATLLSRAQDFGIFYDRKFDLSVAGENNPLYQPKFGYESPHSLAVARVPENASVLDIGCASGYVSGALKRKGCKVTGIDQFPVSPTAEFDRFVQHDLDRPDLPVDTGDFDFILLLDVIEHLRSPEGFVETLRRSRREGRETTLLVSTGNVAFLITRIMLLLGFFNYGSRGILDLTHTRLFTFGSLRRLFEQAGYEVMETRGIPAPFPLALGETSRMGRFLLGVNRMLIKLSKSLFAYQIFLTARPAPSLAWLLRRASEQRSTRTHQMQ